MRTYLKRVPKRAPTSVQDFPQDLGSLTATQYRSLLELCERQDRQLEETRECLDRRRDEADRSDVTGLWNARGLRRRTQGRDWGWWVACDLNHFKAAQDTHEDGHAYGDRILVEFAKFLQDSSRREDVVAHLHGDEFLVWCETRAGAVRLKEVVRAWASQDGRVTASAGVGDLPETADAAMYLTKGD